MENTLKYDLNKFIANRLDSLGVEKLQDAEYKESNDKSQRIFDELKNLLKGNKKALKLLGELDSSRNFDEAVSEEFYYRKGLKEGTSLLQAIQGLK